MSLTVFVNHQNTQFRPKCQLQPFCIHMTNCDKGYKGLDPLAGNKVVPFTHTASIKVLRRSPNTSCIKMIVLGYA